MSFYDKYQEFLDYKDTDDYQKYLNLVKLSLSNEKICPSCSYQVVMNKDTDIVKLNCKKKCGWSYELKYPVYVNLYEKLYQYKQDKSDVIYKMIGLIQGFDGNISKESNIKKSFDNLKRQYKEIDEKIVDIESIFKNEAEEVEQTSDEGFEIFNKLIDMYLERKKVFSRIKKQILRRHKIELMNAYNEKLGKDKLYQLGDRIGISPEDVDNWIKWFGYIQKYADMLKELHELAETENEQKDYVDEINNNLMVEMPEIKEIEVKTQSGGDFLSQYRDKFGIDDDLDDDMAGGFSLREQEHEQEHEHEQDGGDSDYDSDAVMENNATVQQPIAQPIGQPMTQPIGQPIGQSMTQPIGQPMTQPMTQPIGQPNKAVQPVESVPVPPPIPVPAPVPVPVSAPAPAPVQTVGVIRGTLDPKHSDDPMNMIPRKRNDILTPLKETTAPGAVGKMKINLTSSQLQHLQGGNSDKQEQKLPTVKEQNGADADADEDDLDFF